MKLGIVETLAVTALFTGAIAAVSTVTSRESAGCSALAGRAVTLISGVHTGHLQARGLEE